MIICHILPSLTFNQICSNYSEVVTNSLVTLLVLFEDIFHQPFYVHSDLSSATLSESYDSSCYSVCTSVDMLYGVNRQLQSPKVHLYNLDQLVSLTDFASAVDPAMRAYVHQLFSQLCDGTSSRRERGRRAGGRVQRKITTESRGRRVITSRDNNNNINISPSAVSSLVDIPFSDNIGDYERLSTATSRSLNNRSVGMKSAAVCDVLNTNSPDVLALQET